MLYCEVVCYGGKGVTRHISLLPGSSWNGFHRRPWDITWSLGFLVFTPSTSTLTPIILSKVIACLKCEQEQITDEDKRQQSPLQLVVISQSTIYLGRLVIIIG